MAAASVRVGSADEEKVEAEECDDTEDGNETRKTAKYNNPAEPTKEEREEHEKTHVPYRSWCKHCVRGGGKELAHKRSEELPSIPEVHMDFCYMGDEQRPGETITILVAGREDRRWACRPLCRANRLAGLLRNEWCVS